MIFSVLAFLATIISMVVKTWKKSLIIQSFNCIFEGIYDILIKAYTGVILSLINLIRTYLFLNNDKFSKNIYNLILVIFELIIVISCAFTWMVIYCCSINDKSLLIMQRWYKIN